MMISIPGVPGKDLCDRNLGQTRRDILRVGGSSMLGLGLGAMLQAQAQANPATAGGPGWGKAKSIILCYLQGGQAISTCGTPKSMCPTM